MKHLTSLFALALLAPLPAAAEPITLDLEGWPINLQTSAPAPAAAVSAPVAPQVQYLPQPQPVAIPTGNSSPSVLVINTAPPQSSGMSAAELIFLRYMIERDDLKARLAEPQKRGIGGFFADVLTGVSTGFAQGAAINLGSKVSEGWF